MTTKEERFRAGLALVGKLVTFAHMHDQSITFRVLSVAPDGLVEVEGYSGVFAPHLFRVVEDTPQ